MTNQHVHFMFGMSEQGILKAALHKAEIRHVHQVISFNDWFAYGPLEQLHQAGGENKRLTWLSERLSNYERLYTYNPDHQTGRIVETIESLPDHTNISIWHGDHAHDQIGVRFVLSLIKDREMNISLVNPTQGTPIKDELNDLAVPSSYPVSLSQLKVTDYIPFLHKLNELRILTQEERSDFVKEWERISTDRTLFRIWENGLFRLCTDDVLDQDLQQVMTEQSPLYPDQYVPASKVVSEVLLKRPSYYLRKDFLEYRLRWLIENKQILFKGAPGQLHRYSVKNSTDEVI
ncbi:DUF1835 domain-containing protein [Paenibacillus sp. Marseille-Q4541]|uniref:DUF1835 domain-containing protein n=1 Tax=Paenibacillus sp. Marseille-Q4541 TaxID=2831522 RepID=UPI001BA490AF|nr:DUF1835 domain-containing protein [Paenibacillus sp. Marseille-Q4541]